MRLLAGQVCHGVQLEQGGAEVGGVDGEDGHAAAGELRHAGQVPSPAPGGGAYIHRQQLGGREGYQGSR